LIDLWVDDLREPPEGWVWVKTAYKAQEIIVANKVDRLSLDHDLGGTKTIMPLVDWLCRNPDHLPDTIYVHSSNPVGRNNIKRAFLAEAHKYVLDAYYSKGYQHEN